MNNISNKEEVINQIKNKKIVGIKTETFDNKEFITGIILENGIVIVTITEELENSEWGILCFFKNLNSLEKDIEDEEIEVKNMNIIMFERK